MAPAPSRGDTTNDSGSDPSALDAHATQGERGHGRVAFWSFEDEDAPSQSFEARTLTSGALFGDRFRVERSIGAGGMGQVFAALDLETNRPVALKVMRAAVGGHTAERFLREAELMARLVHTGILSIHGGGVTVEGLPFMILELVEDARTLDHLLGRDMALGLQALHEVARAVGHAHRQGVVHRDLKPSNVLIGKDGRARVCDFGVAWADDIARLTRTGELVGTPIYMAPEGLMRRSGEKVEATADVWALGVMLYEHLTGRLPFNPSTVTELMAMLDRASVDPPRRLRPEISRTVEAVCLRALSRDPKARYPDGDAFAEALDLALVDGQERRGLRGAFVGAAVLTGAALLVLPLALTRGGETEPPSTRPVNQETLAETHAPVDPEQALAQLLIEAHEPTGFRQAVLDAFARLETLATQDPDLLARVRLERLDYLSRRGRWEQVLAEASALERSSPLAAEATLVHALTLYQMRAEGPLIEPALAACREQWAGTGGRRRAPQLACGAWLALFEGAPETAVERARQAQQLDPELLPALLAEAVGWGRLLNIPNTLALVQRARQLVPDHPAPLFLLALCEGKVKRREQALDATQAALALVSPDPPWMACKFQLTCLVSLKRFEEAEEFASQGLKRHPDDPRWQFAFGWSLARRPLERWRGISFLQGVRREAPEIFEESLQHFAPIASDARELVGLLDETSAAHLRAGVLYEQAMERFRAGDLARCNELLQEAAAAELPEAMFILGENYSLGRGLPQDDALALEWFRKAAEAGSPGAKFSLGVCYAKGRCGLTPDRAEAYRYYLAAAEGGYVQAMVNLGSALRDGWGGAPDDLQAGQWWERAAGAGNTYAMLNLGKLYAETGRPQEAARWWREAARQGGGATREQAQKNLRVLLQKHPGLR